MAATVATGCSSINQCPELEITTEVTSLATKRRTSAMVVANDLSAPIPSTGPSDREAVRFGHGGQRHSPSKRRPAVRV
jgi:hypothetical protein